MKKVFLLTLVLVLSMCVFASHRISVSVNPYEFQFFVQHNIDSTEYEHSFYGVGGDISYDWNFYKGFRVGADVRADTYFIKDQNNFTDVGFLAKVGYIVRFNSEVGLYGNMKGGLDFQMHDGQFSPVIEFGPEIGVEFSLGKHFDLFVSAEGLFGFPIKDGVPYSEFRITPSFGGGFTF